MKAPSMYILSMHVPGLQPNPKIRRQIYRNIAYRTFSDAVNTAPEPAYQPSQALTLPRG